MIKDKLLKIKEMAERGIEGEKETAKRMLEELMQKYGITEEDLKETEERYYYWITCNSKEERTLLFQTLRKVTDKKGTFTWRRRGKECGLKMTKVEYIRVRELFLIYKKEWKRMRKNILDEGLNAFLSKNNIFPSNAPSSDEPPSRMFWSLYESLKKVKLPYPKIESRKEIKNG